MNGELGPFLLFWGIWLLIPMMIDGATALAYFLGVVWVRLRTRGRRKTKALRFYPTVSVVIPVHNGAPFLGACLASIRRQNYPHDKIEVIVADNLSDDDSFSVFQEQQKMPFEGQMSWISIPRRGKAWALNAGFHAARGEILANIDCDVILHPNALLEVAKAFETDPSLSAATGAVEILPIDGFTQSNPIRYLLRECEYQEYYEGFKIGRQYQTATNSLFTLAGAFSSFRREVLYRTFLYERTTVSEDTQLTFEIHKRFTKQRVACIAEAIAYVEPIRSLSSLYSQRVRWQRGQLEVTALYPEMTYRNLLRFSGLGPTRFLLVDHTLAFPRMTWFFVLPLLYFFGYPLSVVIGAFIALYLCYMGIAAFSLLTTYLLAEGMPRRRIRDHWWVFIFMPAYRMGLFWFRFGGFVNVFMEPAEWRVKDPWTMTKEGLARTSDKAKPVLSYLGERYRALRGRLS